MKQFMKVTLGGSWYVIGSLLTYLFPDGPIAGPDYYRGRHDYTKDHSEYLPGFHNRAVLEHCHCWRIPPAGETLPVKD